MKPSKQRFLDLRPALKAFVPLLAEQKQLLGEEANTNKAWHLGRKEFEFVATLNGHMPVNKSTNDSNEH